MGKRKKKAKSIYDDSLAGIFFKAGITVFVFLMIGCILLLFFALYRRDVYPDGMKLTRFCFLFATICSYGPAVLSLAKVWRQERLLGIRWKDRNDHDRPEWERDWYLDYDRGGFLLCHRAYIDHILGSGEETEYGHNGGRAKVFCVMFEDIAGKQHTLRFSSASLKRKFLLWYEKRSGKERKSAEK